MLFQFLVEPMRRWKPLDCLPTDRMTQIAALVSLVAIAGIILPARPLQAGIPNYRLPAQAASSPIAQPLRLEIQLSRRQLRLYQGETMLKSYPVAVGREGWQTPTGSFQVMQMIHQPAWKNPFTGAVTPGGSPGNPLGQHWIGFWTDGTNWVGMHGTPNPESVGRAVSHGCVRMYNEDIEELFSLVSVGTPVVVVP